MIKVTIADDHRMVSDGIKTILENSKKIRVIDVLSDGAALLRSLSVVEPDVLLMDIDMPVMNGIEAMQEIKRKHPGLKVIILTMHEETALVKKFNELGAKGFLLKNSDQDELLLAVKKVHEGGHYYSANLTHGLINNKTHSFSSASFDDKKALLTDRETEILKLIAEGYSNKEIGEKLFISHRTVDTHRTNLMNKLEVNNIAGLIRYAIKNGFVN